MLTWQVMAFQGICSFDIGANPRYAAAVRAMEAGRAKAAAAKARRAAKMTMAGAGKSTRAIRDTGASKQTDAAADQTTAAAPADRTASDVTPTPAIANRSTLDIDTAVGFGASTDQLMSPRHGGWALDEYGVPIQMAGGPLSPSFMPNAAIGPHGETLVYDGVRGQMVPLEMILEGELMGMGGEAVMMVGGGGTGGPGGAAGGFGYTMASMGGQPMVMMDPSLLQAGGMDGYGGNGDDPDNLAYMMYADLGEGFDPNAPMDTQFLMSPTAMTPSFAARSGLPQQQYTSDQYGNLIAVSQPGGGYCGQLMQTGGLHGYAPSGYGYAYETAADIGDAAIQDGIACGAVMVDANGYLVNAAGHRIMMTDEQHDSGAGIGGLSSGVFSSVLGLIGVRGRGRAGTTASGVAPGAIVSINDGMDSNVSSATVTPLPSPHVSCAGGTGLGAIAGLELTDIASASLESGLPTTSTVAAAATGIASVHHAHASSDADQLPSPAPPSGAVSVTIRGIGASGSRHAPQPSMAGSSVGGSVPGSAGSDDDGHGTGRTSSASDGHRRNRSAFGTLQPHVAAQDTPIEAAAVVSATAPSAPGAATGRTFIRSRDGSRAEIRRVSGAEDVQHTCRKDPEQSNDDTQRVADNDCSSGSSEFRPETSDSTCTADAAAIHIETHEVDVRATAPCGCDEFEFCHDNVGGAASSMIQAMSTAAQAMLSPLASVARRSSKREQKHDEDNEVDGHQDGKQDLM